MLAWLTLMGLLLLAYIYAENTKWNDSLFKMPTKYNISALLEEGMDDDMTLGPGLCDVCNKSFSSHQCVAMDSDDRCTHLSYWPIPTEVWADLLKQKNFGDASVISKCLWIYADTNPSYSWI